MKFITNIINNILHKIIKEDKKILGRWNTDYCDTKMNRKVDLSNEDHCGPCGQYNLDKTTSPKVYSNVIYRKPTYLVTKFARGNVQSINLPFVKPDVRHL